jgi:hypothetical protein
VFGGHQVYEFLPVLFDQCLELEYQPGPALGVDRGPGGLRRLGDRDNLRQDCGVTVLQMGLHLPGARIVDRAGDSANARDALAVDELADRARHGVFLSQCLDAMRSHAGTRRHWTKVSLIPRHELASCPHVLPIKSKLE